MEMNGDESVVKPKTLALKSVAGRFGSKTVKTSKVQKLEEVSDEEASAGDSDEKEIAFIIRRFQKMYRKNKIFSGKRNGFRGLVIKTILMTRTIASTVRSLITSQLFVLVF